MVALNSFFSAVPFFLLKIFHHYFRDWKNGTGAINFDHGTGAINLIVSGLQQLKNSILYFLAGSIVINIRQYDDPPELAANQDRLYAGPGN